MADSEVSTLRQELESLKGKRTPLAILNQIKVRILSESGSTSEKEVHLRALDNIAFEQGIDLGIEITDSDLVSSSPANRKDNQVDKAEREPAQKSIPTKKPEDTIEDNSYKALLKRLITPQLKEWLADYKQYYMFRLEGDDGPRKAIFIHGEVPSSGLLKREFRGFDVLSVNDFLTQLEDGTSSLWRQKNLCFLVLSDSTNEGQKILDRELDFKKFENFKYNELILDSDEILDFEYEGERFLEDLACDINISLTNANLSKSEEILIKKFFPMSPSLVRYRVLKGGFSGSKVVEVTQVISTRKSCRFILKIGKRNDKKIKEEEDAFVQWVSNYDHNYQVSKKENATHEAIKYTFASKDGKRDSESFSDFFSRSHVDDIRNVVTNLFDHKIFEAWQETQLVQKDDVTVQDHFSQYLKVEKCLQTAEMLSFDDGRENVEIFKEVLGLPIGECVYKVCHGDLHSENINIDENEVFLIDFGFTGQRPGLVDFAALEASIRLKLTPPYIPTRILKEADAHFLNRFDLTDVAIEDKIDNESLKKSYSIIAEVRRIFQEKMRTNSERIREQSQLEFVYLISLFCMIFRNLNYNDLNQKYAIVLCRQLANEIKRIAAKQQ